MTAYSRPISFTRRLVASLVTAFAVAAIGFAVPVLLFYGSAGADPANFASLADYFFRSAIIAFVALAVFAFVGIYRYWYLAMVGALIAGVLGSLLGGLLRVVASGTPVNGDVFSFLGATLVSANLYFSLAVFFATVTAGSALWRIIAGGVSPAGQMIAIVRAPAENLAEGMVTHIKRKKVNTDRANEQWDAYVVALSDNDWDIVEVPTAPELADSVFVEDALVVFGRTAVVTSPGAESRRDETESVEATARDLGLRIARITLPGTLDGGDVLKVGSTVYVGRGGRTNGEGIRQLRALVVPLGFTVVAVPIAKALHLKSAVTALPDGTVIGHSSVVENPDLFDRYLDMPEESGAHVVVLAADTVLMAASAPKSAALLEDLGYRVVSVDISEFEKLEGCVTCLSIRVR